MIAHLTWVSVWLSSGPHITSESNLLYSYDSVPLEHGWKLHSSPGTTLRNPTFCPQNVFTSFVWFSQQSDSTSRHITNRLIFGIETGSVYCAVRTESRLNSVYNLSSFNVRNNCGHHNLSLLLTACSFNVQFSLLVTFYNTLKYKITLGSCVWLLDPRDGGKQLLREVRKYLLLGTASSPQTSFAGRFYRIANYSV